MITLITGQPGAGKTLYALTYVKNLAEKDSRQVYFSGIDDLKLPWIELDKPEEWFKVPAGSIVIIDECQRAFRPRGNGSNVPVHVERLETHRHDGVDLFLITQHPMLADQNVRRLVGQHFHVVRAFGTKKATIHEWSEVKSDPDKSRVGSIRHDFLYPTNSFSLYKSAELHTHKKRIPFRVYFLFLFPLILGGLIYFTVSHFRKSVSPDSVSIQQNQLLPKSSSSPNSSVKTTRQFLDERVPRLAGLAYTAPIYDEVTRPVDAPFPAACLSSKSKCSCFSQAATILDVPDAVCRQIVQRGYFKDWEGKARVQDQPRVALTFERSPVKPGEAVDRIATIPPPPPLRVSKGFGAAPWPDRDSSGGNAQTSLNNGSQGVSTPSDKPKPGT